MFNVMSNIDRGLGNRTWENGPHHRRESIMAEALGAPAIIGMIGGIVGLIGGVRWARRLVMFAMRVSNSLYPF
jgi:hypothetical protein